MKVIKTGTMNVRDAEGNNTGQEAFIALSYIDEKTGREVLLPPVHPLQLGAYYDVSLDAWVLEGK